MDDLKQAQPVTRRNLLRDLGMAAGAATVSATASAQVRAAEREPSFVASGVDGLAQLRDHQVKRASSYDTTGGNDDAVPMLPGQTVTFLDTQGPGVVTHIWCTINSVDQYHLKNLVFRAYWDGEEEPSVEVPLGDFFGLGLGEYFLYQSALLEVAPLKAMNAWFPMPFRKSAKFTLTNEGVIRVINFFYNVDYYLTKDLPSDLAYFHAQYRQNTPTKGNLDTWTSTSEAAVLTQKNLLGEDNYVFLEATGRGHFVGVTHSILQNQDGWIGEGDEMIFIDDNTKPAITGTGTEDYYGGAWNFGARQGAQPFGYQRHGAPSIIDTEMVGGRISMYRWHIDNPICFQKSFKMTMEHGHANHRSDNWFTTAYWYQVEPHMPFPKMPGIERRTPHVLLVGGPGVKPVPPVD